MNETMIPSFKAMLAVYCLTGMIIIPVIINWVVAVVAPRRLWLAPIILSLLHFLETYIFFPEALTDFFWYFSGAASNNSGDDSSRGLFTLFWVYFLVPLEVISIAVTTGITYVIIKMKDKRKAASQINLTKTSEKK